MLLQSTYLLPFNSETRRNVTIKGMERFTPVVDMAGWIDGLPTDQKSS